MNHSNTDKTERGHSMLFYTAVLELLESYFPYPAGKNSFSQADVSGCQIIFTEGSARLF